MGFFDIWKSKEKGKFQFQIEDTFALKDGSAVIAGLVLSGTVAVGDRVSYVDRDLQPVFECRISGIEQPGAGRMNQASSSAAGRYGAHFAFLIKEHSKSEFEKENYLIQSDNMTGIVL
ncbi:hypothetical protein [Lachnotalea sp. AF33-28]|jgi:translation elongation factor EF-Tu-like GTPase|uniref:hypothetical protein n=1 Tax=Lachnotalea sp. AF33-28 TaxID=2292046 RepID=UPI000E4696DE|nr:hypothetical protein [Lachnotalea sp. AF33-28]RHP33626.1 hypothetical protein DWZ56_10470 [Lachnotalea sp. AF33-28]